MPRRRVVTIDCEYLRPRFAAAYLLVDDSADSGPEAAFVDNNTAHSVPLLLKALHAEGLSPEQVRYIIITHVHLDHAGGTSELMKACPRATLLAHPRAARHMIDPSKLVASARRVYGEDAFTRLYGAISPVPETRVRTVEDEERIPFAGGPPLRFFHTRGHANHHFCIDDPATHSVFTGDSFGLAYPVLQRNGLFIFPSTSPTDFHHDEAVKSLERIVATGARQALLTHYGAVTDLTMAARQLREHLAFSQRTLEEASRTGLTGAELDSFCMDRHRSFFREFARSKGLDLSEEDWDLLKLDLELNAQGVAYAATRALS